MCGHVGVASKHVISAASPLNKALKELLYLDAIRGWDATGALSVMHGKEKITKVIKKAEPAADFLKRETTDKFLARHSKLFIGHNRAANVGAVNDRNSHPFVHSHITMAHNGTLWEHDSLPRKSFTRAFDVDSEAICHALSVTADTNVVLEQLLGAFALVWYDQRLDTLNFARNDERPFHYAVNTLGTELLWASDKHMLEMTIARKMHLPANYTTKELPTGEHLVFDMANINFLTPDVTPFQEAVDYWTGYTGYNRPYLPTPTNNKSGTVNKLEELGYELRETINFSVSEVTPAVGGDGYTCFKGVDLFNSQEVKVYRPDYTASIQVGDVLRGQVSYASTFNGESTIIIAPDGLVAVTDDNALKDDDTVTVAGHTLYDGTFMPVKQFTDLAKEGCGWCSDPLSSDDAPALLYSRGDNCLMHKVCHNEYTTYLLHDE